MIGTQKLKQKLIKDFKNEAFYAITLTHKYLRHTATPRQQFKDTYKDVLKTLEASCDYEIYPEWRDTNNSLHWHGVICIKDKIKWHKSTLPKLNNIGFNNIKPIDELMGWLEYCQKESAIAKEILKPLNIPFKNGCISHIKPILEIVDNVPYKTNICECIECLLSNPKPLSL